MVPFEAGRRMDRYLTLPPCDMYRLTLLTVLTLLLSSQVSAQIMRATPSQGLSPASQIAVPDMGHGTLTTVRTSGTDAGIDVDYVVPDGGWVYGIELGERSDVPCHLELKWATIDDDDITVATTPITACHGTPTRRSLTSVGFNYVNSYEEWSGTWLETFTIGGGPLGLNLIANSIAGAMDNSVPRHPLPYLNDSGRSLVGLKGLQMCQRNSNDRMKGLRVRGVTLRDGGTRFNTRPIRTNSGAWQQPSFERPNCNDWDDMEVCPNGQVMVGVRVRGEQNGNYVGSRPRVSIEGLAPICTRLQIED